MQDKTYFENFDGLRGYAVLSVSLYHAAFPFFGYGGIGVQVFFFMPGFFLLRAKNSEHYFRNFYIRRTLRIGDYT